MSRALVAVLSAYRHWLSPMLAPRCRFYPSCSAYAISAIEQHGPARGCWLALRRLVRCQPFFPGGYDPVPSAPARDRSHQQPRGALR